MIKDALHNIFAPRPPVAITATVAARISPGRYSLTDDAGRTLTADSTLTWSPGARVTVQAGRIVAGAGTAGTIRTYEV
jgi:hypothetical protein